MEGYHYAVSARRGVRFGKSMEDTYKAFTTTIKIEGAGDRTADVSFFGVFDGHAGGQAADFTAENIGNKILDALLEAIRNQANSDIESANKNNLLENKNNVLENKNLLANKILEDAVKAGYLRTDEEFLKLGFRSGTTSVTALIIDGKLVVSNAGDSRAVVSKSGKAEAVTEDHKAARKDEQERIRKLGGIVFNRQGVMRLGALDVSRAIGDAGFNKERGWLTAEPDTRIIEITSDYEFLILATDGLWNAVSNEEAVEIARPLLVDQGGLTAACEKLIQIAVDRHSEDDITVLIIQLPVFRKEN